MELQGMHRLARILACMMWFAVWQLNGANCQLTVEVRQYTTRTSTAYKTLRSYSDPSGAPPLSDWFTTRYVNIPDVIMNETGLFQANGGIIGRLYYLSTRNACSEVDAPPTNSSDTVWFAILGGYPTCILEKIMLLNTSGYRVMITYSDGDTNRVPPSGTDFPVAIVTEEFANYLIQNATVTSADGLISVHISSNITRRFVIVTCIIVALLIAGFCLLVVLCDFLRSCFSRSCSDESESHNISGYRNPTTRQRQQSQQRAREHSVRDEQQNSTPGRSDRIIELREMQHIVETVTEEVNRPRLQPEEAQVVTMANVQQLSQGHNSELETQQQIGVNEHQETLHQQSIYQNVRTSVRGRRAYNMHTDAFRSCPICLEDFTNGETIRVLPCDQDHIFHLQCVNQWLCQHQECPVCRENVTDGEERAQPRVQERGHQLSAQQQQHRRHPRPRNTQQQSPGNGSRQQTLETQQQIGINEHQETPHQQSIYQNVRTSVRGQRAYNMHTDAFRSCPICLEDFTNGETIRVLPCDQDHIFHLDCVNQWLCQHQECPVCRENVTDGEERAQPRVQERGHQLSAQQQQHRRHPRPQNTNVTERARQPLPEPRQQLETAQHWRQEEEERQPNQQRGIPRLLEEGRPREATQQGTGNNQQPQSAAEPLYGNVRTTSFRGHRQFNIQSEPCKTCSVCLVDFDDGETVRVLPCDPDHIFHAECLQPWITRHRCCPLCRSPTD